MRDNWKTIAIVTILAVPLSGCSSFLGMHLFARAPHKSAQMVARAGDITPMTRDARDALNAGRPGEAIEKFQKALASGEPIAPALNGMAVAYARIGRLDLAERFFREAISVDPMDQRYQTNLAALIQSPDYAPKGERTLVASADTPAAEAAPQAGQLQRVSLHEVRIVSAEAYPAPFATRLAKIETGATGPSRSPTARHPAQSHQAKAE